MLCATLSGEARKACSIASHRATAKRHAHTQRRVRTRHARADCVPRGLPHGPPPHGPTAHAPPHGPMDPVLMGVRGEGVRGWCTMAVGAGTAEVVLGAGPSVVTLRAKDEGRGGAGGGASMVAKRPQGWRGWCGEVRRGWCSEVWRGWTPSQEKGRRIGS